MTILAPSLEPLRLQLRSLRPREAAPRVESGTQGERFREDSCFCCELKNLNFRTDRIRIYISGPRHTSCVTSFTLPVGTCGLISDTATMPTLQEQGEEPVLVQGVGKPWRGRPLTLSLGVSALGSVCPAARCSFCFCVFGFIWQRAV